MFFYWSTMKFQRLINTSFLFLNGLFFSFLAYSYIESSSINHYEIYNNLFKPELAKTCTESNCFLSLTPFLAVLYGSVGVLCILGSFLYENLKNVNIALIMCSCVHLGMGMVRGSLVPKSLYNDASMSRTNMLNLCAGFFCLLLILISLLFPKKKNLFPMKKNLFPKKKKIK
jgi:hypothetical protein